MNALKRVQRAATVLRSPALCLLAATDSSAVSVACGRAGIAHVSGEHRCGSPWACPVCAPLVRQLRAGEVNAAMESALRLGLGVELVTTTLPHGRKDSLSSRLDVASIIGGRVRRGASWDRYRHRLGYIGCISALELTWSARNGWHPHRHDLYLFARPLTKVEREALRSWMFGRVSAISERHGFGRCDPRAFDVRPVELGSDTVIGDYVTKVEGGWSPGSELARSDLKVGRRGEHLTPFELLRWLTMTGEAKALRLWQEFELATKGKNALRFSPGLRALLLPDVEDLSDVELASSNEGGELLLQLLVDGGEWNRLVGSGRRAQFLDEFESAALAVIMLADLAGAELNPIGVHQR